VLPFGTDEAIGYALPGALNCLRLRSSALPNQREHDPIMFVQRSFTHRVTRGLDPRVHLFRRRFSEADGLPSQARQ
jgi:hypothetical protein